MILVFTGHMIDTIDRPTPRYPDWLADRVGAEIRRVISALDPTTGYAAAACGGDIQFLEELQAQGREPRIVLPFSREDFVDTSVAFAGSRWVERFDRLMNSEIWISEVTEDPFLGEDELYDYGFEVMLGMALKQAERLGEEVKVLAALDGGSNSLTGGTRAMLDKWGPRGIEVIVVRVDALRREHSADESHWSPPQEDLPSPARRSRRVPDGLEYDRVHRTMMFADIKGFGKLSEVQSPAFFIHFLEAVKVEIDRSDPGPLFSNTWGDGLFLVFEHIAAASEFALRLRDRVRNADWGSKGLPQGLAIRIGMHSGPVFRAHDPIINDTNWFGAHVNRAARIEPMAEANTVWCSGQTAALIKAQMIPGFQTILKGVLELPKRAGKVPLYELDWAESEQ